VHVQAPIAGALKNLTCPICLSVLSTTVTAPCLHRFCQDCIEKWLRVGKPNCPECKAAIPSRRSFKRDVRVDEIIGCLLEVGVVTSGDHSSASTAGATTRLANAKDKALVGAMADTETLWVKTKPVVVSKREMRKRRKLMPAESEAGELDGESTGVPAAKDESEESEGGPEESSGSPRKVPQEDGGSDGGPEDSSGSPQKVPQEDGGSQEDGAKEDDARSQTARSETGGNSGGEESNLREGGSSLQPAAEVEEDVMAAEEEEAEEAEDRDRVPPAEDSMSHPNLSPHSHPDPNLDPSPDGDQVPPAEESEPAAPPENTLPGVAAAAAPGAGAAAEAGAAPGAGAAPAGALTEEMVHQLGAAAWEAAFPASSQRYPDLT